jgi:hypothetical protein
MLKNCNVVGTRPSAAVARALLFAAGLAGCTSIVPNTPTIMADPGAYEWYTCDQIAVRRQSALLTRNLVQTRIDKATQTADGVFVSAMSHQIELRALNEDLKVLDATARAKNCPQPAPWRSNTVIR